MTSNSQPCRATVASLKAHIQAEQAKLREQYESTGSSTDLLESRAELVDSVLIDLWRANHIPAPTALLAVGGYGRGELYPYSDVDILLLLPNEKPAQETLCAIECFIGNLWDTGLDVGHSVRTSAECVEESERDITIQTNLLESRLLIGDAAVYQQFLTQIARPRDPESFFHAKRAEQEQRYNRFNHTPFSVEPNCKESPGGLRDLQTITWITRAASLGTQWADLVQHGLITASEVAELRSAERFLHHARIRLHYIAGRREDRLLFDHQEALAKSFGIEAVDGKRASEVLMQRYYRVAKKVTQLNTILLQNIGVRYQPAEALISRPLTEDFQVQGNLLDMVNETLFIEKPTAILESFLLMQQNAALQGMTARTLRALWRSRQLITPEFRANPQNRATFLRLFQQPRGQTHEFRRLNQYGILGAYLPAFAQIEGQMQHDLFHVYTVDQHILQVLRNVRRLSMEEHAHEYPLMTQLINGFERHWLLFIAALFHDIAKGRGGDHSKLGMADAKEFCENHGLSSEDTALVVWLVEHHLTMSQVAQKQDLADPDVVRAFASLVKTERQLTALYILTHADIRGTSPKVWNGWKARLLEDLFLATRQLLRGDTPQQALGIAERQQAARDRLRFFGLRPGTEDAFWGELDTLYYLRHDAEEIVWHTRALYYRPYTDTPVVKGRLSKVDKGIEVMVYMRDQQDLFVRLCGFFSRLGYSILDAKIHTTEHGYALDTFQIMDPTDDLHYRDVIALIEHELTEKLTKQGPIDTPANARLSRQLKHFPIAPTVTLQPDERGQYFILSIVAADRPGLLFIVAKTLAEHGINLHTAKIATLGERAEDTFLVSGPLLENSKKTVLLEADLIDRLKV